MAVEARVTALFELALYQFTVAKNRTERCAKFMAHVSQKAALGVASCLSRILRSDQIVLQPEQFCVALSQLCLRALERADVMPHDQSPAQSPLVIVDRRNLHRQILLVLVAQVH